MSTQNGLVQLVWLRDESLEDFENLPPPEVIAQEIVQDLEAALAEFSAVAESLGSPADTSS
jgi:type I restriction enzyme M protein